MLPLSDIDDKLIYFETTDSTGMIQAEILDYVDEYWKFQVLKNKNDYLSVDKIIKSNQFQQKQKNLIFAREFQ